MKDLIERYVYDVVRRLPEKDRAEVRRELLSNLSDMLPEDADEEAAEKVLTGLGSPAKLAEQYRQQPRYLISPAVFDEYLMVLKLVFLVVSMVVMMIGLIGDLIRLSEAPTLPGAVSAIAVNLAQGAATGATSAFLWVTLVFAAVERLQTKHCEKEWSVGDLPELPAQGKAGFSRGETVTGMVFGAVFSILFLVVLVFFPQVIGWYDAGKTVIPLFDGRVLQSILPYFIPFWVLLALYSLAVSACKLYYGQWNWRLVAINGVYNLAGTILTLAFIHLPDLFNEAFLRRTAEALNQDFAAVSIFWDRGIFILSAVILVIALFDLGESIWLTYRDQKSRGSV